MTLKQRYRAEYGAWKNARLRCRSPKHMEYHNYGGRGIRMHDAWQNDFAAFLEHIGPKPDPKLTLDRINNEGNYEPGNVAWRTHLEQQRNRRGRRIYYLGETLSLSAWAVKLGISVQTIKWRVARMGVIPEVLSLPFRSPALKEYFSK
jgi:hypothetical protein